MSLNLCFKTSQGGHYVEFPFDTPTELSRAVFKEQDTAKRIQMIHEYMDKFPITEDQEYNELVKKECEDMLKDITLTLSIT